MTHDFPDPPDNPNGCTFCAIVLAVVLTITTASLICFAPAIWQAIEFGFFAMDEDHA